MNKRPVAYDLDNLDYCSVCGWTAESDGDTVEQKPRWQMADHEVGPPDHPVTLCGGEE